MYNLEVAEYHTYFVGGREWGFSAWAHNAELYNATKVKGKWVVTDSAGAVVFRVPGGLTEQEAAVLAKSQADAFNLHQLPQGLVPAGAVQDLTGLEKTAAERLQKQGDLIIGAGDPAVRKVLGIPGDPQREAAADLLSITKDGEVNITEVKDSKKAAAADALRQLRNTVDYLQRQAPGAKIGKLSIAVPEGASMAGNYGISADHLLITWEDGVEQVVTIGGKAVHVMEVPSP